MKPFKFGNREDAEIAGEQAKADFLNGLKKFIVDHLPRTITNKLVCETPECRAGNHRRTEHGRIGCLCAIMSADGHLKWCPCKKVYD